MSERRFDFKTLRALPAVILAFLIIIPVVIMAQCAGIVNYLSEDEGTVVHIMGKFAAERYFFKYIIIIGLFVCLYRLADITKWFARAWFALIINLIAELFVQVMASLASMYEGNMAIYVVAYLISVVPDICLLFAMLYVIRGFGELYERISDEKGVLRCRKLSKFWVVSQIIILSFYGIIYALIFFIEPMISNNDAVGLVFRNILAYSSVPILICYIILGIYLFRRSRNCCYDFYMYTYNKA